MVFPQCLGVFIIICIFIVSALGKPAAGPLWHSFPSIPNRLVNEWEWAGSWTLFLTHWIIFTCCSRQALVVITLKYYKLCFETMTQKCSQWLLVQWFVILAHVWKPQFLDCRTAHSLGISKVTINWNVGLYNCVCVSSRFVLLQVAVLLGREGGTGGNLSLFILCGCSGNPNFD